MIEAYDIGNDVLLIQEKDKEGNVLTEARGWVSAINNYQPPENYLKQDIVVTGDKGKKEQDSTIARAGDIDPKAKSRKMSKKETEDYCARLIAEAKKSEPTPMEPVKIL